MLFQRHAEAGHLMVGLHRRQRRLFVMTPRLREGAAGSEPAPFGHGFRQRNGSGNSGKRTFTCAEGRNRAHQSYGVRVLRVGKNGLHAPLLYHLSGIHYRHLLLVCYDLRFPVWSRNTSNEYDLLIYVANWPIPRRKVWDILLQARALENISYVCGVNRIGKDGRDIPHSGGSVVYSPKGEVLATVPDNEEAIATASLNLSSLQEFRLKFPAWKDADEFVISSNNSSQ